MKVFLVVVVVIAWFHTGEVKCEAELHVGLHDVRFGNPIGLSPPSSRYYSGQYRNHRHSHYDDRLVDGSYGSSEYAEYGNGWDSSPSPPPSKQQQFRSQQHPNSLGPSEYSKPGFEVVRAPVIYHQTVTDQDSDVTRALADALGVVQTLRQPGSRHQGGYSQSQQDSGSQGGYGQSEPDSGYGQPVRTLTNVEYVSHSPPQQGQRQNRLRPTTVTTTIVDVPQRVEVLPQRAPSASPVAAQPVRQQQFQVPAAADLPPAPPSSPATVIATSATPTRVTVTNTAAPARPSAAPVRSSAVLATPSSAPRLIIPSQSQVTTLARTSQATKVQTLNSPRFQTVIQPVYIPYAVDQHGQPVGPLPDYHTMDFGALLNAQQQLLTVAPHATVATAPTVQVLEAQPQQLLHVEQPQQQLIQVQQPQQQLIQQPQQQLIQVQQPQQQLIQVQQPQHQLVQVEQPQQQLIQVEQPQQQLIQVQQPQQQLYIQQDHVVAASSSSSSETTPDGPSPTPTSTRYGRRRRIKKARKIAQRA